MDPHRPLDDIVALMTLVTVTCPFDAGQKCEVKWQIDGPGGHEAELQWRVSPEVASLLKVGDVYSMHIRRL